MWFLTTYWFVYLSVMILVHIDKSNWLIVLVFDEYGEAIIEIPLFIFSVIFLLFEGTKQVSSYLKKSEVF